MTKLPATSPPSHDEDNRDSSYVIQPSLQMSPLDDDDHSSSSSSSGRFLKIYNSFFSPVYVYYLTISTSYVYTDTTTFFITSCIPQPFSYSICRTVGG